MDNWNDFMRSKQVRIIMNGLCSVITASYAVGGVMELMSPNDTARPLIEQLGTMGYYALTVARILVCAWVAVVFARMTLKVVTGDDKQ